MPIYKAKKIDSEKIEEIVRVHPHCKFELGMKEDWEFVHEALISPKQDNVMGIDASWWDTPILKIYDSENNIIGEMEVWKEFEYESSEESRKLNEELLADMRERRKAKLNQSISSK